MSQQNALTADQPINSPKADRLGYSKTAELLARAFLVNDVSSGFVIGVEGGWGSGKSSLVEMSLATLAEAADGPIIVRFTPWLVGDRDALLHQFFADLGPAIEQLVPPDNRQLARDILRRYGQLSKGLAAMAKFAGHLGLPGGDAAHEIINQSSENASQLSEQSLSQLNTALRDQLAVLDGSIIVFIDDLDRLEPAEVVEVLRLVRAVADFPNIAYILAYDPDVLSHSLENAINVPDGRAYLEKMVQASFKIPAPMNFDLRNWLQGEVDSIFPTPDTMTDQAERLAYAIEEWTGLFIRTPRDIVRVVNALKLYATPVLDHIDPADMVFLQIMRTQQPDLHAWIERYVLALSDLGDDRALKGKAHDHLGKALFESLPGDTAAKIQLIRALQDHLPGLDLQGDKEKVMDLAPSRQFSKDEEADAVNHRRLYSPTHFRYYFAFSEAAGTISDQELATFLTDCVSAPANAIATFDDLTTTARPQGGLLAEVLLERLVAKGDALSAAQIKGLFGVLGNSMDTLVQVAPVKGGYVNFVRGDRHQVFGLVAHLSEDEQYATVSALFEHAGSLAWLSGIILSAANDYAASQKDDGSKRPPLLSENAFDMAKSVFCKRLEEANPVDLVSVPYLPALLSAWDLAGGSDGLRMWALHLTPTDQDLIDLLENCLSWSQSNSDGARYTLRWSTAALLFDDIEAFEQQLSDIASDKNNDQWIRDAAAKRLAELREDRFVEEHGRKRQEVWKPTKTVE